MEKKLMTILKSVVYYMTLLFIALRACDVIDWPWWAVLSPTIAVIVAAALVLIVVGSVYSDSD